MKHHKLPIPGYVELGFDSLYLLGALGLGLFFAATPSGGLAPLWGAMVLALAFGDAFHLVPRMLCLFAHDKARYRIWLGRGKQITSVTMTLFYAMLWHIGTQLAPAPVPAAATVAVHVLAAVRMALCLLPQNGWTQPQPSARWAVVRNVPFLVQGAAVAALWWRVGRAVPALHLLWLAVLLSFAFYIPVAFWAHKNPKLGMLMLPKTCMYIWIACMGFGLL